VLEGGESRRAGFDVEAALGEGAREHPTVPGQVGRVARRQAGALGGARGRIRRERVEAQDELVRRQPLERVAHGVGARGCLVGVGVDTEHDPLPGPPTEEAVDLRLNAEGLEGARAHRHDGIRPRRPPHDGEEGDRREGKRESDRRAPLRRGQRLNAPEPRRLEGRWRRSPLEERAYLRRDEDDRERRQHLSCGA
jgi:hypothetical protein